AQTCLASSPLASGTVGQRPGSAFAVPQRLDQVAQRAARTRDHHGLVFCNNSSLAVNPNGFPFEFTRSDAVVAAVPEQGCLGSERLGEPLSQELAVYLGPAHAQIMTLEVSHSGKRLDIRTAGLMLNHVLSQDGFTRPARSAVDQHNQLLLA